jgi:thioredoxin 1
MELTFTDANFEAEVLKSDVPVLVDFWAPWCGPCQMMAPILEELAKEYEGKKIKIGSLNVDENMEVAGKYEVMSVPTFIVFKGGAPIDSLNGGIQKEKLAEMLDKYLA